MMEVVKKEMQEGKAGVERGSTFEETIKAIVFSLQSCFAKTRPHKLITSPEHEHGRHTGTQLSAEARNMNMMSCLFA